MRGRTSEPTGAADRPRLTRRVTAAFGAGPLAVRDFRLFGLGQLGSTIGDFCYAVALPWLVLSAHGGTVLLGTVLACYGVPRTVLIPVGGVLADRLSPRAVMLAADIVRCALVTVLAAFAARSLVSLAFLGPVAALIGAGEGLFLPASAAIMPSLLPANQLQAGNGLSAAMIQMGSLIGPVAGGILVSTTGPTAAFAVDAASFAVSAGSLALMRGRQAPAQDAAAPPSQPDAACAPGAAGTPAGADIPAVAGVPGSPDQGEETSIWRFFLGARVLQAIVLISVLANFVIAGAFEVALPALAHARFGPAGYGALIACFGGGAVVGTLAAARTGGLRRPAPVACIAFLVSAVGISLVPFLGSLAGAAAATLVFGACTGFGNIVMITLLQQWAPAALLGRIMGVVMLASMGTFPVSVALTGVLVRSFGPTPFFPVAGAVLAVAILGALTQREIRDFGTDAALLAQPAPAAVKPLEHGVPGRFMPICPVEWVSDQTLRSTFRG
jgi:predicted MFS family arabinose efflux permease